MGGSVACRSRLARGPACTAYPCCAPCEHVSGGMYCNTRAGFSALPPALPDAIPVFVGTRASVAVAVVSQAPGTFWFVLECSKEKVPVGVHFIVVALAYPRLRAAVWGRASCGGAVSGPPWLGGTGMKC